jgi:hypothetical protein
VFYDADPNAIPAGSMSFYAGEQEVNAFRLSMDHRLKVRYGNSLTAKCMSPTDRIISLALRVPWTSTTEAVWYDKTPSDAVAATIKFAYGDVSTTFTIGAFYAPDNGVEIRGKEELFLELNGGAYSLALDIAASPETGARELVIANDATV